MNATILVFFVGTVLSFPLVLWLLMKPAKKKRPAKSQRQPASAPQSDEAFQNILKKESFDRAVRTIGAIQTELDLQLRMAGRNGRISQNENYALQVSQANKRELQDCVSLVETLFSEEASDRFKTAVRQLAAIDQSRKLDQSTRYATTAIGTLRSELQPKVTQPDAPAPRPMLSHLAQSLQLSH